MNASTHYHVSLKGEIHWSPLYARQEKQEAHRDAQLWRKGGTRAVVVPCTLSGCEHKGLQLIESTPDKDGEP